MNNSIKLCFSVTLACLFLVGCTSNKSDEAIIYQNDSYTVKADRVIQGDFEAVALSPTEIVTNYRSPADQAFSPVIEFRFSLNSRDNELKAGQSHFAVAGDSTGAFVFGTPQVEPVTGRRPLAKDTEWTVRVDMSPVLNSFKKYGYYVTAANDTIYKDDFKGVWIAGNAAPLTWDFENLYGKDDRKLKPVNGGNIYEVTLNLNPATEVPADPQTWKIGAPDPDFPQYTSREILVDALYNMAVDNIKSNIRPDDTYRAGAGWDGVWTRDVSYSIYLALGYLDPVRSMNSLKAKVKNDRIIQDTGTGGSWPVSSDRIVWSIAAWEIYKVTGDKGWLTYCYNVIKNSLEDDRAVVWDRHYGLMHGEQSYLDWREQSYPKWMQPKDIYESMTLGTNVLFARAYEILSEMGDELGIENNYDDYSEQIIKAVNKYLWLPDKGYYSGYLYGGVYPVRSQSMDNLGQALSILWDVADDSYAESIIGKTPVTPFGTTSIFPQIKDIKPYHNDAVWPFVQAFWNLAAAKAENETAVNHGLGALYRAAALFGTHKELFVASTGDFRGTAVNSDKMLWSSAGNAAMIFRMFAGMNFKAGGIEFEPFVPASIKGVKRIDNFKYRNSVLNITIDGTGNEVKSMSIDGKDVIDNFFPATMAGSHDILIKMGGRPDEAQTVNNSGVAIMPTTPALLWNNGKCEIENYNPDNIYSVYLNGILSKEINNKEYSLTPRDKYTVVYIAPHDKDYSGFIGIPYEYIPAGSLMILQCENYAPSGTSYIKNPVNRNFVEISTSKNTDIKIPLTVAEAGTYFIDVRYANGSGPVNTDNKCAIRTLFVNGTDAGAIVMPQRGIGEWMNTGFSNMLQVNLNKGENVLQVKYVVPQNVNMNTDVNTALMDYVRIIKK